MLAYTVHDVYLPSPTQTDIEANPDLVGQAAIRCTCGHTDGFMPKALANLLAHMHIHGVA